MKHAIKIAALLVATFAVPSPLFALPHYAMRSGRTCGNCHISPTYEDPKGWDNPELAERKCNMSCSTCHVNPGGGGLRNTSGRYYGQSTLSILALQERSYSDYDRELLSARGARALRDLFVWDPEKPRGKRSIPSSYEDVKAGIGQGQRGGLTQFARPLLGPSELAFWDGRYGDLNADPLIQMGGDLRVAYWSASGAFFPMQLDLHAALHPVEHLTLMATAAGRGRSGGFEAAATQDRTPFFPRNAFLMVHELPYMAYVKAGIFMPSFGTYLDDHTSFTRDYFELDVSTSDDTVLGVEVGVAPNYPFATISAFRNFSPYLAPDGTDPGFGAALNLGWRDLGFSVSAHGILKRRDLEARGDLDGLGIAFGFNPFFYSNSIPLTYLGELSYGRRQRPGTGSSASFFASVHELWWTVFNGFSLRGKYDLGNRDLDVAGELEHRLSLALDLSLLPGVTFVGQGRYLLVASDERRWDALLQLHLWF